MRIGGKLRRLRQDRRLTQVQMAEMLEISPSYLNLLESNQRPVTVRVLLKLADKFQLDLNALAADDDERLAAALMEAFSDPIFDSADVKASDVRDVATTIPAFGRAVLALYDAYKSGPARAAQGLGEEGAEGARSPSPPRR